MALLDVPGAQLHYRLAGEGEPLLMIRDYGSHLEWWDPLFVRELQQRFTLVLYDHRGTGRSRHEGGDYTLPRLADDAAALLEGLGIKKANVFGLSMGGMVAQELALRYPHLIKVLVLGATNCGGEYAVHPAPEVVSLLASRAEGGGEMSEEWMHAVFTPEFVTKNPGAVKAYQERAAVLPTPTDILGLQVQAVSSFNTWDRLPQVSMPTWILHSERDVIVPPPNAFILRLRIPLASALILPGLGHDFPAQDPLYSSWIIKAILPSESWDF